MAGTRGGKDREKRAVFIGFRAILSLLSLPLKAERRRDEAAYFVVPRTAGAGVGGNGPLGEASGCGPDDHGRGRPQGRGGKSKTFRTSSSWFPEKSCTPLLSLSKLVSCRVQFA